MAQTVPFPQTIDLPRRIHRAKRTLESKFHEIRLRSPKDAAALHVMADMVISRLNEIDRRKLL